MIAVSSMTLGDIVSMLYARAGQYVTPYNTDWGEMVRYIVEARRELFVKTSPYKEWAYQQTVGLSHQASLPTDFIRPTRLVARDPATNLNDAVWKEARRVDPREWRNLTNPVSRLSFVRGSDIAPIYMIFANVDATPSWAATPMAVWIHPVTYVAQLDYVASYSQTVLSETTDPVNVPVEMEGLLIDLALLRLLTDIGTPSLVAAMAKQVYGELSRYQGEKATSMFTEAVNTQALPNPAPAQVPAANPQGGQ